MKVHQVVESQISPLPSLGQTQKERLAYVEFRLYFLGEVRRQDLMNRFGVASAVATRDFSLYKELFPGNIRLDGSSKAYVIGTDFVPGFDHRSERVLTALSQGFGDGITPTGGSLLPCELPMLLNRPSMEVFAPVTRAIHLRKVVKLRYFSHSSGMSTREIIPFALVNDGLRWHARAFDRKSQDFRDFVFTRMEKTSIIENESPQKHEFPAEDIQWNRVVELELVPHPKRGNSEIIERDYGMTDGALRVNVRAANVGYFLRQWIVDCSHDHSLEGEEYRLWLKDDLALYGVSSAIMAPGYQPPRKR